MFIEKVRAANFRSVGNAFVEFDYTETASTLVTAARNGSGKSTVVLHSLVYALYNKSYDQGTKLPDLVNSINKKKMLVEVDFKAKGSSWTVRRGMKPAVFDLLKDGEVVHEDKHADEKQDILESLIGTDFKTFCFTVALGKDRFVPFISMTTAERRHAIDTIWDLGIFSNMQTIARKKVSALKKESEDLNYRIKLKDNDITHAQNLLSEMQGSSGKVVGILESRLGELVAEGKSLKSSVASLEATIESLTVILKETQSRKTRRDALTAGISKIDFSLERLKTSLDEHTSTNSTCSCCGQAIPQSVKDAKIEEIRKEISELESKKSRALEVLEGDSCDVSDLEEMTSDLQGHIFQKNNRLERLRVIAADAKNISAEIKKATDADSHKLNTVLESIEALNTEKQALVAEATDVLRNIETHATAAELLSDSGVKQDIIVSYIPFLNERVNDYLTTLDFPVVLDINSSFDVNIVSPNKQGLSVWTLSTGQKCRIDLALLFALRDISKNQSGSDFNLILLDETLENMSSEGIVAFSELMRTKLNNHNVVCISQRGDEFETLFDRRVDYDLEGDFTIQV